MHHVHTRNHSVPICYNLNNAISGQNTLRWELSMAVIYPNNKVEEAVLQGNYPRNEYCVVPNVESRVDAAHSF